MGSFILGMNSIIIKSISQSSNFWRMKKWKETLNLKHEPTFRSITIVNDTFIITEIFVIATDHNFVWVRSNCGTTSCPIVAPHERTREKAISSR